MSSKPSKSKGAFLARVELPQILDRQVVGSRIYWQVRAMQPPQRVLEYLGRCPDDSDQREVWMKKVRAALERHGLDPGDMKKVPKRLPIQTYINRAATTFGGDRGRAVRPSGIAPDEDRSPSRVDQADRTGWARHGNPRK